jgi:heat shock protein HtpX
MAETAAPLLVHNRIDANRRNTRLLVVCFTILLLPVIGGVSWLLAWLVVPSFGFPPGSRFSLVGSWRFNIVTSCIAVLLTIVAVAAAYLTSLFSWFLLWKSSARPLGTGWLELRHVVEHLCIGIGLTPPRLYVTTSEVPNAFAVGCAHNQASLVVSKGLLTLLDRRELAAVVAHELSHIANRDTDLSTLLAAFASVARLPQRMFMSVSSLPPRFGTAGATITGVTLGGLLVYLVMIISDPDLVWFQLAVLMLIPSYLFLLAPLMIAFVGETISHERELLADADAALLTRDPEALALALAKVSAAVGAPASSDPALAHLFFVDPAPTSMSSWLGGIFPTHPSSDERIDLLRRMGDGVVEDLAAASEAGLDYRGEMLLRQYAPPKQPTADAPVAIDSPEPSTPTVRRTGDSARPVHALTPQWKTGSQFQLTGDETPLYEKPDGWSIVLQKLSPGLVVTCMGFEGNFARVRTEHTEGYIARFAPAQPANVQSS